jgi:hypothetical protein
MNRSQELVRCSVCPLCHGHVLQPYPPPGWSRWARQLCHWGCWQEQVGEDNAGA